jgi:peroxiredoxin Q/BCP
MSTLVAGSIAPDFEAPDQNGAIVRLSSFKGQKAVVLYFYPKDDTTGCTIEACRFRDDFEKFREAGAEILGVSDDSTESHEKFIAKYRLPFTLLSDKGGKLRKLYGVKKMLGIIPGRMTFVIGRDGLIKSVYSSATQFAKHVEQALTSVSG